jgi:membrane-associated phospholipid phosphatase
LTVLLADWPRALRVVAIGVVLLFLTTVVTETGKFAVDRVRPAHFISDLESKGNAESRKEGKRSFPSGHATAAFCVYATMARFYPRAGPLFLVLAVLCAVSRVGMLKHYPSDVFAGALIGYYVAKWVIRTGVFEWLWPEGWPRWLKAGGRSFMPWRRASNGKT